MNERVIRLDDSSYDLSLFRLFKALITHYRLIWGRSLDTDKIAEEASLPTSDWT